jgi:hypothetical protein
MRTWGIYFEKTARLNELTARILPGEGKLRDNHSHG